MLTRAEALDLLERAPLADLMARADAVRRRLHGARTHFTHSLNLNPTNVCENRCDLCAFWREPSAPDAYVMDLAEAERRLRAACGEGLTEVHVVGGVSPRCDLAYHERLLRLVGEILPGVLVQGLTAVEIHDLAARAGVAVEEALDRLRAAGLGAIPGGGAEIFADDVRRRISARKISGETWLSVHEAAHRRGIPSNATMLFGHVETPADVVDHLDRLRSLQERTGGFRAFVPIPFHPAGTRLGPALDGGVGGGVVGGVVGPTGVEILRVATVARLYLENVPHVRVLANYVDRKLLQVLLRSGVDDAGGTSLDERIAAAAGAPDDHRISSVEEMTGFLEALGLEPVLVDSLYRPAPPRARPAAPAARRPSPPPAAAPTPPGAASSPPGAASSPPAAGLDAAMARAAAGDRLSSADAALLGLRVPFHELGALAHRARLRLHPADRATFVVDRNVSLTNVCEADCLFCAFHVPPGAAGGFALSADEVVETVLESARAGATQVLIQGGLNPALDLGFYLRLFERIKAAADVWLHALSPIEVAYIARREGITPEEALRRLRAAGLDSLPGGGAEILVEGVRRRVSPKKPSAAAWFEVMRAAHRIGMTGTATMVYGLGETLEEEIEHLVRIRDLQDETGGFTAFIPWSFQSGRTRLDLPPRTGPDYLRVVALARLVLDNVPHLQAGWVTEGADLAQAALHFGADDMGGVLMDEQVVASTGAARSTGMHVDRIVALIRRAGFVPVQRTTLYEPVRTWGMIPP